LLQVCLGHRQPQGGEAAHGCWLGGAVWAEYPDG
jgi:hypothetical protein